VAGETTIAASNDPFGPWPFIGSLGDHGYFLAHTRGTPNPQWWLVGVDVRDGQRLFAPVRLGTTANPPRCFLNGPTAVLCLYDHGTPVTAWVVDIRAGVVSFTGPTELRVGNAKLAVKQVGIYAVAETQYKGVSGVGPNAEPTWFVPGDGGISSSSTQAAKPDGPPFTLAIQNSSDPRSFDQIVFSVSDGTVIKPEIDNNARQEKTLLYPGGFAADIAVGNHPPQVELFDIAGKRTSSRSLKGFLNTDSHDLPILGESSNRWAVYTAEGDKLLEVSGEEPNASRLVGTRLFVDESENSSFPRWQQYDLKTGAKGNACEFDMGYRYLGTDGSVGVFMVDNPEAGLMAKGRDLGTCDTLWSLTSKVGSLARIWRINTTLVQLSDDGTELVSLVAPS
jgi:hypothetical protein